MNTFVIHSIQIFPLAAGKMYVAPRASSFKYFDLPRYSCYRKFSGSSRHLARSLAARMPTKRDSAGDSSRRDFDAFDVTPSRKSFSYLFIAVRTPMRAAFSIFYSAVNRIPGNYTDLNLYNDTSRRLACYRKSHHVEWSSDAVNLVVITASDIRRWLKVMLVFATYKLRSLAALSVLHRLNKSWKIHTYSSDVSLEDDHIRDWRRDKL